MLAAFGRSHRALTHFMCTCPPKDSLLQLLHTFTVQFVEQFADSCCQQHITPLYDFLVSDMFIIIMVEPCLITTLYYNRLPVTSTMVVIIVV